MTPLPAATPLKPGSAVSDNISFNLSCLYVNLKHTHISSNEFHHVKIDPSGFLTKPMQEVNHKSRAGYDLKEKLELFNETKHSYLTLNPHFLLQTFPFFGVEPTILNEHGEELEGEAEGYLVSFIAILFYATLFIAVRASACSSSPPTSTDIHTDGIGGR